MEVEGLDLRPIDREALANVMLQVGTVAMDCTDPLPADAQIRVHTDLALSASVDVSGNLGDEASQCVSSRIEFMAFALRMTATQLGVSEPITLSAVVADGTRRLAVEVAMGTPTGEGPLPSDAASSGSPEGEVP